MFFFHAHLPVRRFAVVLTIRVGSHIFGHRVKRVRVYIMILLSRTDSIKQELNFRFFFYMILRTQLAVADMTVRVLFGKQMNILRNVQHTYTHAQTCCAAVPPIVRHEPVIRRLMKPST